MPTHTKTAVEGVIFDGKAVVSKYRQAKTNLKRSVYDAEPHAKQPCPSQSSQTPKCGTSEVGVVMLIH